MAWNVYPDTSKKNKSNDHNIYKARTTPNNQTCAKF